MGNLHHISICFACCARMLCNTYLPAQEVILYCTDHRVPNLAGPTVSPCILHVFKLPSNFAASVYRLFAHVLERSCRDACRLYAVHSLYINHIEDDIGSHRRPLLERDE